MSVLDLIAVLGLCLTSFGLGLTIGIAIGNKKGYPTLFGGKISDRF